MRKVGPCCPWGVLAARMKPAGLIETMAVEPSRDPGQFPTPMAFGSKESSKMFLQASSKPLSCPTATKSLTDSPRKHRSPGPFRSPVECRFSGDICSLNVPDGQASSRRHPHRGHSLPGFISNPEASAPGSRPMTIFPPSSGSREFVTSTAHPH